MARRREKELAANDPNAAPDWVMQSRSLRPSPGDWWQRWLKPGQELTAGTYVEAYRSRRAAAVAWCEERGHSYCRTVLGWRLPASREVARGCTTVPGESR